MERITSTEFQKAYPRLSEPHEVTALGRVIGTWYPQGTLPGAPPPVLEPIIGAYSSRPFTPAPKPGKGKEK